MSNNRTAAEKLSYMSKLVGQDEDYVQAGGGNTSVKLDDSHMIVKSSGVQLTEVTPESGYSLIDYKYIADQFAVGTIEDNKEQMILEKSLIDGRRPSIETFLHALTRKYTIHTHPLGVLLLASSDDGMSRLKEMFPNCLQIPYATPGIRLAKVYYDSLLRNKEAQVVFLASHGLLVSADSMDDVIAMHQEVMDRINGELGLDSQVSRIGIELYKALQAVQPGAIAYKADTPAITEAVGRSGGAWKFAYSPDCVVYCGSKIALLTDDYVRTLQEFRNRYGEIKAVVANGCCFAVAENVKKARDTVSLLDYSAKIYLSGKCTSELSGEEIDYLTNWDSEKYRSSINNT